VQKAAARLASVNLLTGDSARALLQQTSFRREWDDLYRRSAWGTVFQKAEFVLIWYETYARTYAPVVVTGRDADGTLAGLLLLAASASRSLVPAGAHHAEYHAWLASEEDSASFVEQAFSAISREFRGTLRFECLPPGVLVADSQSTRSKPPWFSSSYSVNRGLLETSAGSDIHLSLKKKSNKSRLNRLERIGPLTFKQLTTPEELERWFDEIIAYCDLRQGAVHNSLPFAKDPLKRQLYLNLMTVPDLLHVTVLRAGDQLVSAQLNVTNKAEVLLGLIVHSPFLERHSPGKLHILLLASLLSEQGHPWFDLTPGGDYKDRFASKYDSVSIMTVFFDKREYLKHCAKQLLVSSARRVLQRTGISERNAKLALKEWRKGFGFLRLGSRRSGIAHHSLYALELAKMEHSPRAEFVKRDSIQDLLAYSALGTASLPVQAFLQQALRRLAAGCHVYTFRCEGTLQWSVWTADDRDVLVSEGAAPSELDVKGPVVFGFIGDSSPAGLPQLQACISRICINAAASSRANQLLATTDEPGTMSMLESLGFERLHTFTTEEPERSPRNFAADPD
jgi:CelD/BcsL family acetyltransferase involved in cellulose biosynthesis